MPRIRILLFIVTMTLIGFGLVMIYSTSAILAQENYQDASFFLKRQFLWIAFGLVAMGTLAYVPLRLLQALARPLLLATFILLILVLFPQIGKEAGGARRWLRVGPIGFQPSEIAKLSIILYFSSFLSRKQQVLKQFWAGLVPALVIVCFVSGLILLQPDLGTSVSIAFISLILFFIAGARVWHLAPLILSSFPLLYGFIMSSDYRRKRILSFLDPWKDPGGTGFQIIQSFIALGSGGILGTGLGASRQKYFYLPEAHTDFIFSIVGEELGLLGTGALVLLFTLLVIFGFRIAMRAPTLYSHLLGMGIVCMIASQALMNMCVATGCLPTKGMPLPFISFGGSNLVLNMAGIGLLLNVGRELRSRKEMKRLTRNKPVERTPRRIIR